MGCNYQRKMNNIKDILIVTTILCLIYVVYRLIKKVSSLEQLVEKHDLQASK